jgi:Carbohydrate family 9 binding domain-like
MNLIKRFMISAILVASMFPGWALSPDNCLAGDNIKLNFVPRLAKQPAGISLLNNTAVEKEQFTWAPFSNKVEIFINLPEPKWIKKIKFNAYAIPSKNISEIEIAAKLPGNSRYVIVDRILNNNSGLITQKYALESKTLNIKTKTLKITLNPAYLEVGMILHDIELSTSTSQLKTISGNKSPMAGRGHIVIGGKKKLAGFLFKRFNPGKNLKLRMKIAFLSGSASEGKLSIMLQKINTATGVGLQLRSNNKQMLLGYVSKGKFKKLVEVNNNIADITINADVTKNIYYIECNGKLYNNSGKNWPLQTNLSFINQVLLSVFPGKGSFKIYNAELTLSDVKVFKYDFNSEKSWREWRRSGQVGWTPPEPEKNLSVLAKDLTSIQVNDLKVYFYVNSGEVYKVEYNKNKTLHVGQASQTLLQTIDEEKQSWGINDKVITVSRTGANGISFKCSYAADKSIIITKTYQLDADKLIKKVSFLNTKPANGKKFISSVESLNIPKSRISNFIFNGGDPWYSPRVNASDIKFRALQRGSGISHAAMALNKFDKDMSVALVRYKLNGRFVWPISGAYSSSPFNKMYFYPNGIQVPIATLPLKSSKVGYETILMFFKGNEIDFVKKYAILPEVRGKYAKIQRPEWIDNVICQIWVHSNISADAEKRVKQLIGMTSSGNIMVILNQPFIWGDFGEKTEFKNIWGAAIKDTDYLSIIKRLRKISPRVKVALYTWIWTVAPESDFYKLYSNGLHTRNKNGHIFNAYPGLSLSCTRKMSNQKQFKALALQYKQMMEKYRPDFIYLDGGSGGSSRIDWPSGEVDQDYDWQDFYEYMRKLSAQYGIGGMCFNSKSNPTADVGISEMALDGFRTAPLHVASRIWGGKIQEVIDPKHRTSPCYWGMSDPWYSSICVGMGMMPHIEQAGLSAVEPYFIIKKAPILTVAREMFLTPPVGYIRGTAPKNPNAKVAAFGVHRANSWMISLISNLKSKQGFKFAIPFKEWIPKTIRKLFVWQNDLLNPNSIPKVFTEKQQIDAYDKTGWKLQYTVVSKYRGEFLADAPEIETSLRPKLLTILGLSASRAVIWALDGLPTQNKFSSLPGIEVVMYNNNSNEITVKSKTSRTDIQSLDVACLLPAGKSLQAVDGGTFKGLFKKEASCFVLIGIRAGKSALLKLKNYKKSISQLNLSASSATPGTSVPYNITENADGEFLSINIVKNKRLYAIIPVNGNSGKIAIPELVRKGKYQVNLISCGQKTPVSKSIINITRERKVPYPRLAKYVRQPVRIKKVANPQIEAIALNGNQEEKVDLKSLKLRAKIKEWPDTLWTFSSTGVKFKKTRWLRIRAQSDIASRYCVEPRRVGWGPSYAGLLVDYEVNRKFVKRVALSFGLGKYLWKGPTYGKGTKPDQEVKLSRWIKRKTSEEINIDLGKWAPAGWQGKCWVTVVLTNVLQGRKLDVQILDSSWSKPAWADTTTTLSGDISSIANSAPSYKCFKKSGEIVIDGKGADNGWENLPEINDFRELGELTPIDQKTSVKVTWDSNFMYMRFVCAELNQQPLVIDHGEVYLNDSMEIFFYNPKGKKRCQIVVSAAGHSLVKTNYGVKPSITASAKIYSKQKKWIVEVKIPLKSVPGLMPRNGIEWLVNLCRNRPRRYNENKNKWVYSAWARIPKGGYFTPAKFGKILFQNNTRK